LAHIAIEESIPGILGPMKFRPVPSQAKMMNAHWDTPSNERVRGQETGPVDSVSPEGQA